MINEATQPIPEEKTVYCIRNCKNKTDQWFKDAFVELLVLLGIQWKKMKKKSFQVRIETNLNDNNDPASP